MFLRTIDASVSVEADTTAISKQYSTRYSSQVALCFFSTEQSNPDKRRLDRERCLSHPVASLGESWNRDPEALSTGTCVASL